MRYHNHFLGLLLATAVPALASAQYTAPLGDAEHRYQFDVPATMSAYNEKVLTEAMSGFDPDMKVNVDRPTHVMKVLAYRPIDPNAIVHLADQFGLAISVRRTHATRTLDNQ